jgi:hypothetical protein
MLSDPRPNARDTSPQGVVYRPSLTGGGVTHVRERSARGWQRGEGPVVKVRSMGSEPAEMTSHRALLLSRLGDERQHVLAQLDGLTEEQLRRPVLPSGWSCLGLVRHLTFSDERYWFEVVVAGEPLDFWPEGENGDWLVEPSEPVEEVLAAYRAAIARSDEIIAARRLDDPPKRPEQWWDEAGLSFPDLHSIIVHVLVETCVHAGHLDAVRELLDGHQHIVL